MPKKDKLPSKKVLEGIDIHEISFVTRPAQTPALVRIMKKDDEEEEGIDELVVSLIKRYIDPEDGAVSFSEIIEEKVKSEEFNERMNAYWTCIYSLETSLQSIAGDADISTESKMSIMRNSVEDFLTVMRDKFEDFEDFEKSLSEILELEAIEKGDEPMPVKKPKTTAKKSKEPIDDDSDDSVDSLKKQIEELATKLEAAENVSDDTKAVAKTQGELDSAKKELEEANDNLEKAEAERDEAKAIAAMSDFEKEYLETLEDEARAKFIKMSTKDRKKLIAKKAENDEEIEVEGVTYKKSALGEDQFNIVKAQATRLQKAEKQIEEERSLREIGEFTKRAEDELEHLPGDVDAKAKVLKAIDSLDDEVKETVTKMLEVGEKTSASAFEKIGHKGGKVDPDGPDPEEFNKKVAEIKKRDDCNHTRAMSIATKEYPELFEAYQKAGSGAH